jgi:cell division protein FtsX
MVAGVLYGAISAIAVLSLLYPILLFRPVLVGLDPTTEILFGNFNSFDYYVSNFPTLFLILMGTGTILGALSSFLAVRRYLKS